MACSTPCFSSGYMSLVWHICSKGTLHQGGAWVFAVRLFQCVACPSLVGCFSALHLLVFVFTFVGCVECHVANCFGLWCGGSNALFQRASLLQQLICHVEVYFDFVLSDMQLVFFCRGALDGDRYFLFTSTVFDATRRKAHCLFVFALRRWSCSCFRRVAASVSGFRQVCPQRGLSLSGFVSWLCDS